ncbi:glycosyltransferase family 2 protein [Proteus mirabilis]|uniref:Glycosyl transferase family protein n=5 Tax=Proteus TaxID=583 RepID=A0A2X2C3T5_PROMI|nr:glycosyltransferase family 2 protein [Proteus mirabilis]EEI50021.1 glycosyltransferase, group 2 family protein [Proteus mirabilis ATCC 29906]EKU3802858.1 glycosyltransferase family 2 protein [Proteus mirabilis]EKV9969056.1 glycosyltransferase family 2 protein [Proteus mirabilis]ELA6762597.1 glycosyltransferase family 2 protein [Proteus mirabilis]ELA7712542.1 glycosyltransferase family 2 protein [Proteus mirabilis]
MNIEKKDYLVSIIMPCFNSEKYISEAIESVLKQTYSNFELIIIDDNSTDSTLKIINSFRDNRITIISFDENQGAGVARNKGIEVANGRFIAFLDSDDLWSKNKLEAQIKFMLDNNYHLTYSYYQCFDKNGISNIKTPPLSISYNKLLYCNIIGCLTAIYDSYIIGKQYMPLIRKRQDMGLWLKILKQYGDAYCLPYVLASYRTDSGMTKNKFNAALYQWKFYKHELKFNLIKSLYYFIGYTYNGLFKK